ncbi:hypothetical protein KAW18_01205 [candidate division WOR-3 bacterium]|nr:hypothetical protein [candidate division WOR-3 bacterium]
MAITTTEGLKTAYPTLCERLEKEVRGETTVSTVTIVKDGQGRISTWTEETRDLDKVVIGKRVDKYTYYSIGEINTITMKKYDSDDVLTSKKVLKHYKDGTQPNLTVVDVQPPIGPQQCHK